MAYRPYIGKLARDYANASRGCSRVSWLLAAQEEFILNLVPPQIENALDIGCGAGSLVARLAERGVRSVQGLDISDIQVEICRNTVLCAEFMVGDCREIGFGALERLAGRFQYVNASWIFDSADSISDLYSLARGIARSLKCSGLHTGICLSPEIKVSAPHEWWKYGISLMDNWEPSRLPRNGELISGKLALATDTGPGDDFGTILEARYFSLATYDDALRSAGFKNIEYFFARNWLSDRIDRTNPVHQKFVEYAQENPEMIAYRAELGNVAH